MTDNNHNLEHNGEVDENMDDKWMELISKSWGNFCSSCGTKKDPSKLKVFRKVGPATQVLSECESCGLKTIITVIPNVGMQINQIRTDVTSPQEFEKFNTPVTPNDYLDFYNQTKDINTINDLIKLINNVK
jgi:hypothetical protein